jgi:hypothetical protein
MALSFDGSAAMAADVATNQRLGVRMAGRVCTVDAPTGKLRCVHDTAKHTLTSGMVNVVNSGVLAEMCQPELCNKPVEPRLRSFTHYRPVHLSGCLICGRGVMGEQNLPTSVATQSNDSKTDTIVMARTNRRARDER